MTTPEDQREALARFAEAVAEQGVAVQDAIAYVGGRLLAVQEDHARTREQLYALTQRVADLEQRARVAGRREYRG